MFIVVLKDFTADAILFIVVNNITIYDLYLRY